MGRRQSVPLNRAEASSGAIAVAGNENTLIVGDSTDVTQEARRLTRDIADRYRQGELLDRGNELEELADFLAQKGAGWWGWRGGAWSGKTRLMAEVACAPPDGWRAVGFFIRRGIGENTEKAFLRSMIPQLAAVTSIPHVALGDVSAQIGLLHELLAQAAAACEAEGQRLLVVIDGLDEDAVFSGEQSRSVLDALPFEADRYAVVVASRPTPELRLPVHHPLQRDGVWRELRPVEAAETAERDAREDMAALLGDPLGRDIAALLELTGQPFTARHLAALTGAPIGEVDKVFSRSSGRSFTPLNVGDRTGPGYVLGHLTLQQMLIEHLNPAGPDPNSPDDQERAAWAEARADALSPWSARVREWGTSWAEKGWPSWTPEYLLEENYLTLLDGSDLVDVLTDPARHARIAARYGSLGPALAQLRAHLGRFLPGWRPGQEPAPRVDLEQVGRLMFSLNDLTRAGGRVPAKVPSILARAGQHRRAEHLIDATDDVLDALHSLAVAYRDTAQPERFLGVAGRFVDQLSSVPGMAPATADRCIDMVHLCAIAGHAEMARQVAVAIPVGDGEQRSTSSAAVVALGVAGEVDRALVVAAELRDGDRFAALRDSAYVAHRCGDHAGALHLARAAAALVADFRLDRIGLLTAVAWMYVQIGEMEDARRVALGLSSRAQVDFFVGLAEWHRDRQEAGASSRAADDAMRAAVDLDATHMLDERSLVGLAATLIASGRFDAAGPLVDGCSPHVDRRGQARLAAAYYEAGIQDAAQQHLAAALADDPDSSGWLLVYDLEEALSVLLPVAPEAALEAVISRFTSAVVSAGDDHYVRDAAIRAGWRLAHKGRKADALRLAEVLPSPHPSFSRELYLELARGLAGGPQWQDALTVLDAASPEPRDVVGVADILARSGHVDLAVDAANRAVQPLQSPAPNHSQLHETTYVLSELGHFELALRAAATDSEYSRYYAYFWAADAAARRDLAGTVELVQRGTHGPAAGIPICTGVANGALHLNEQEEARPWLTQGANLLRSNPGERTVEAVRNVACLIACAGDWSAAVELISDVATAEEQRGLFASVAGVGARIGRTDAAREAAGSALALAVGISESGQRVHACVSLARSLADHAALADMARSAADEAHRAFNSLPVPERSADDAVTSWYSHAGSLTAEALALTGRTRLATDVCTQLRAQGEKPDASRVGSALAAAGDVAGALQLVDQETARIQPAPIEQVIGALRTADGLQAAGDHLTQNGDAGAAGLNQLAAAYAAIDEPELAHERAREALRAAEQSGSYDRGEQTLQAARTLHRLGEVDEARTAALTAAAVLLGRRTGGSSHSLLGCAELLKRLDDDEASRRLLAEAWRVEGHPLSAWHLLAELDPHAAVALAANRWPPVQLDGNP